MAEFKHIHCSSRFDRTPESLESDLDNWMQHSSLITLTEVTNNNRAATMREKGWAYYNAKSGGQKDDTGICWDTDVWKRKSGRVIRMSKNTFDRVSGLHNLYIWSSWVVLIHRSTGLKLLVSVTHFPAHIEGGGGFKTTGEGWAARKSAYQSALTSWATHVHDAVRKGHVDATMCIADFNLNLKQKWVQELLHSKFGKGYRIAWTDFPTSGQSQGNPHPAPPGGEGTGPGDHIIDGTIYHNLKVTDGPNLMPRVRSSDHRPYNESFRFLGKGEKQDDDDTTTKTGDTYHGKEWWGFGDYLDDELYEVVRATGAEGGEVL